MVLLTFTVFKIPKKDLMVCREILKTPKQEFPIFGSSHQLRLDCFKILFRKQDLPLESKHL